MQKTGTIVQVVPTQRGGYSSQNGYIYTFDMTIDCPDGQFTGEIGSKAQMYPKGNGEEITVEMTQGQYGPRFRAINPQYAGQQQNRPPQRRQPQTNKPDWDEIARGKVRCNLICAVLQSGNYPNPADLEQYMPYIFTGQIETTGGQPNPDYNSNPPQPGPGDDVPF